MRNAPRGRVVAAALLTAAAGLLAGGCGSSADRPGALSGYAGLPGLAASHHRELQVELSRLRQEKMTPADLRTGATPYHLLVDRAEARGPETTPQTDNLAEALASVFSKGRQQAATRRLRPFFPPTGKYPHDLAALHRAAATRRKYEPARKRFRHALTLPKCDFGIEHDLGLSADTSFVERMHLGARLESLLAAEALRANQFDEALAALQAMLRAAERLAEQKHVVPRLTAARIRLDASTMINEIAGHPNLEAPVRQSLLDVIHRHLDSWPRDELAWIGERSDGLHVYEMVRGGHLYSLLTTDEIEELRKRPGGLEQFARAAVGGVDDDQWFYLRHMRAVIERCDEPYFRRESLMQQMREEIEVLRGANKAPTIAEALLLPGFEEGHRRQSFDLAVFQAWSLVLSEVTGAEKRKYETNPLDGEAYRLIRGERFVRVADLVQDGVEWNISAPLEDAARTARRP